jgi:hypothetical protein
LSEALSASKIYCGCLSAGKTSSLKRTLLGKLVSKLLKAPSYPQKPLSLRAEDNGSLYLQSLCWTGKYSRFCVFCQSSHISIIVTDDAHLTSSGRALLADLPFHSASVTRYGRRLGRNTNIRFPQVSFYIGFDTSIPIQAGRYQTNSYYR